MWQGLNLKFIYSENTHSLILFMNVCVFMNIHTLIIEILFHILYHLKIHLLFPYLQSYQIKLLRKTATSKGISLFNNLTTFTEEER